MQATTDARLGFDLFKGTSEFIFNLAVMTPVPKMKMLDGKLCIARAYHFPSNDEGKRSFFSKKMWYCSQIFLFLKHAKDLHIISLKKAGDKIQGWKKSQSETRSGQPQTKTKKRRPDSSQILNSLMPPSRILEFGPDLSINLCLHTKLKVVSRIFSATEIYRIEKLNWPPWNC